MPSAHIDTFAARHLPPPGQQPEYLFELPALKFPQQLNCSTELLDRHVAEGRGARLCLLAEGVRWTYAELLEKANRIANVLVREMGLVPGNRVLLRAPNNPLMVACWFAVMKAGGIAVATMPLLRAKELKPVIDKGEVAFALCDLRLAEELRTAAAQCPVLRETRFFGDASAQGLEAAMARQSPEFVNADTAADDTCLLAFTSGSTGVPKGTLHFHRDVMAVCACWPPHVLRPREDDVFIGSPPLAFTFGLGGLVLFPMSVGASTALLERGSPAQLVEGIARYGATTLFTAPTSYRAMAAQGEALRATALLQCVSAGEVLPAATRALWRQATGIELIDGIGSTEMLHIFISADEAHSRPGATGMPVPGYRACVLDDAGLPVPPGTVGHLAVKGPTGCRYLADERQRSYVRNGWNLTGDAYLMDADGYFFFQARTDDMIVSAGYNIASPEVEEILLQHPKVAECGVIGVPDPERGQIVKAFVVVRAGHAPGAALVKELQDFVKANAAPYKYPRMVEFLDELPRTGTGKLQRFKLHRLG
ncbi:MAG: Acetyl-coenzyme synthetase [Variovorax sp.]|nr:Acetyl-coenzyme synthetase [Variovorax sp.]